MIRIKGVNFTYPGASLPSLIDLELDILPTEWVGLLGPNAAGKSTLVKLLGGIFLPSSGLVSIDGADTADESQRRHLRRQVGLVFPSTCDQMLFPTVEEEVAFCLGNLDPAPFGVGDWEWTPERMAGRVQEVLLLVGLQDKAGWSVRSLTPGERQKVALASALAPGPRYLALDEPTIYLDEKEHHEFISTVSRLRQELSVGVVWATQEPAQALEADRALLFTGGRLVLDAPPGTLVEDTGRLAALGLELPEMLELEARLPKVCLTEACLQMFAPSIDAS